jgi:hypothetical protein
VRLLPLLLVVCCSASAKWELLEKEDFPPLHRFIDLDNVVKSGQLRRVWTVINYSQEVAGTLSIRTYTELDCQERKSRVLQEEPFSQHWATGVPTRNFGEYPMPWKFPAPNTTGHNLLKLVCSK